MLFITSNQRFYFVNLDDRYGKFIIKKMANYNTSGLRVTLTPVVIKQYTLSITTLRVAECQLRQPEERSGGLEKI